MRILVTGGAGFRGSAVCRYLVGERAASVLNIDKLTARSSLASIDPIAASPRYSSRRADICDRQRMAALVQAFEPDAIFQLAGEPRLPGAQSVAAGVIDRDTIGSWSMLAAATDYWSTLAGPRRDRFRFLQVSRGAEAPADRLAMNWHRTYGLPVMIARSAMVFGPCQPLDEVVPQLVLSASRGLPMAVEGDGAQQANWLHVDDHARALDAMLARGTPGTVYAVGAGRQHTDLAVAGMIAKAMDRYARADAPHADRIMLVANAPAQVLRHAVDPSQLERDTGWRASEALATALARTAHWYLDNAAWWRPLQDARIDSRIMGLDDSAAAILRKSA